MVNFAYGCIRLLNQIYLTTLKANSSLSQFAIVTKLLSLKIDSQLIPTTSAFRATYINLFTNNQKHQQRIVTFKT